MSTPVVHARPADSRQECYTAEHGLVLHSCSKLLLEGDYVAISIAKKTMEQIILLGPAAEKYLRRTMKQIVDKLKVHCEYERLFRKFFIPVFVAIKLNKCQTML